MQQQHSNWKCPQCGLNDISGDRVTCPSCGKKRNRWGYWDCASCQMKGIRADHKECPGCGHPRARNVKFYLRDDLVEFVDEVSGNDAVRIRKANWICPYCNQQNDDAVQTCVYCGASRAESTERYHDVKNEPEQKPVSVPKEKKKDRSSLFVLLLVIGLICAGPIYCIISQAISKAGSKKVRSSEIVEAYWQSSVYLEQLVTLESDDWELPEGARLLRTASEMYRYVDHYEQKSREVWVDDYDDDDWDDDDDWGGGWDDDDDWGGGWEDYGDGQFGVFRIPSPLTACLMPAGAHPEIVPLHYETEYYEEPVYGYESRTKYYYEYDKWVDGRCIVTRGEPGTEPYYKDFALDEKERERSRVIDYHLTFRHKDQNIRVMLDEQQFLALTKEDIVQYRCDTTKDSDDPTYYLIADGKSFAVHAQ